ncbi:MAG TPA: TatD family hydrolase [Luteolibacter sp.]|nr:TatD family hydrolase [Luteolibacter sp.]
MLTDSHCHLASHRFAPEETPDLIERALAAGVSRMVTLATCLDDVAANLRLAENPHVHACVGIHPCDVHHAPDDAVDLLAKHTDDPRVCAIGETGLDYFHSAPDGWSDESYHNRQLAFLERHFELAAAAKLNVVIHTRDRHDHRSFDDALAIYRNFHDSARAVFHCFTGTWENARRVIDLGGLLSFGGVATFKNAKVVRETVRHCPSGSFMLETDAPYLAPEPHRGKRNEPAWTRDTALAIAAIRNESLEELADHTTRAADGFFRFRPRGN